MLDKFITLDFMLETPFVLSFVGLTFKYLDNIERSSLIKIVP